MKITITGSLGNISRPLAAILLGQGHQVSIVSGTADRKKEIEAMGATAYIGDLFEAAFYAEAFTGADAVYAMTPPGLGGGQVVANTIRAGAAMAQGIMRAGVQRVVMLSSIGADKPSGNGPIAGLYQNEKQFSLLPGIRLRQIRAGYFYRNFYNNIPLIRNARIIGSNFSGGIKIPLVHTDDIAKIVADELPLQTTGVRYVVSDIKIAGEVAAAIGTGIGIPDLPWVAFTDEQLIGGMTQAGMPADVAAMYAEMGRGMADGSITEDFLAQGAPVAGAHKLEAFAEEFAANYLA